MVIYLYPYFYITHVLSEKCNAQAQFLCGFFIENSFILCPLFPPWPNFISSRAFHELHKVRKKENGLQTVLFKNSSL